ncbi:hypothetical protein E3Q23_00421 [Wallemia mellicola]|uniref:RING-type domain-containing protein n=1 Tax=Wallemia mellicola TaxID=1708541 RepID=A0A4T0M834_9BASI|nr:hypothetical protein E3Q23_00421 [Wallemia mellicola]TIC15372.1 hypothetical protein E3Q14_00327 [Wallemia mellicola]TIC63035.1 hypothetical protein E3Q01_03601 [Wallemia mellicola]
MATSSIHEIDVGRCTRLLKSLKAEINNFKNGVSHPPPADDPIYTPPSIEGLEILNHTFTIISQSSRDDNQFISALTDVKKSLPKPSSDAHVIDFGRVYLQPAGLYKGKDQMPARVRVAGKFKDASEGFIASLPTQIDDDEKDWLKANGFGYIKSDEESSIVRRVNGWVNATVALSTLSQSQSVADVVASARLITTPAPSNSIDNVDFQVVVTIKVFLKQKLLEQSPNNSLRLLLMRYSPPPQPSPNTPIRLSTQYFYSILKPANTPPNSVHTKALRTPLKQFQRKSIAFMQNREDNPDDIPEPGWMRLTDYWLYNAISGRLIEGTQPPNTSLKGSMLCEEMGLGKTVEILALVAKNAGRAKEWSKSQSGNYQRSVRTSLIVTPDHLLQQWIDEARDHTPGLRLLVYHGYKHMDTLLTAAKAANIASRLVGGGGAMSPSPSRSQSPPLPPPPPPKGEEQKVAQPTKSKARKKDDDDFVPQFSEHQLELFNSTGSRAQRDFLADGTRVERKTVTGATKRKAPRHTFDKFKELKECKHHALDFIDDIEGLFSFMDNHDDFDYETKSVLTNRQIVQDFFDEFDLIISTYSTLSKDLAVAHERQPRARRSGVEYRNDYIPMSPLVSCKFYRVAQDEIQLSGVKKSADMTALIPRQTSVACSGTPITGSIEQLLPILQYLGLHVDGRLIDKKSFASFATHGLSRDFARLIQSICIRTTKDHVKRQLQIPPLRRYIVPLHMGAAEQAYIDEQYKQALSEIGLTERGDFLDRSVTSVDITKLRTWITKLRQLTTHPQTSSATREGMGKTFRTVDQVLERMIEASSSHIVTEQRSALTSTVRIARLKLLMTPPERDEAKALLRRTVDEAVTVLASTQAQVDEHRIRKPKNVIEDVVAHTGAVVAIREKSDDIAETAEEAQARRDWQSHLTNLLGRHRDMLLVLHQAHLILGDIGHQQENQEEEDSNYAAADADRAKYLSHAIEIYNKRVDALSANLKRRIEPKKNDLHINYVGNTELGLDPSKVENARPSGEKKKEKPKKYAEVQEDEGEDEVEVDPEEKVTTTLLDLDILITKLNESTKFILDKRQKVLEGVLKPIDKVEASTEAYGEDAELQANLEIYLEAFESSIKDRREVLGLVDVSDDTGKGGKRRANANAKAREQLLLENAIEVEQDQHIDTEQDILRRQLQFERQGMRITKKDQSFRKLTSELKTWSTRIPKRNIKAFKALQSNLHDVYDKQRDLTRTLNLEKDDFLGTFNSRVLYFKQLQTLSDSVAPLDVESQEEGGKNIPQEIEESERLEAVSTRGIQSNRAKLNYLYHIRNASDESSNECAICTMSFTNGVITSCGHIFCQSCLNRWCQSRPECPHCRTHLSSSSLHKIKVNKPSDSKAEAKSEIGDDPGGNIVENTVDKRIRPQYNVISSEEMDDIEEQKIFTGGHGVKIDTLCKHILTLRAQNVKSVVFSSWQSGMQIVQRAFEKNDIAYTLGSDVKKLESFKKTNDVDVVLLNGERQSSGLNLTVASVVIFIDPIANFPLELQAIGRVDRMGQHQSVKVYTYTSLDTIDDAILDLAALKGQSLYVKDQNSASLSTNDMESLEKAQTKGDFIAKKDDLLSLLLPDVHIPSFTPSAKSRSESATASAFDSGSNVKIEEVDM